MSNERRFKTNVQNCINSYGWCFATHDTFRKGVPDLTAVIDGRAVWWELKWAPTDDDKISLPHELTAPQSKMLRDVADAGAVSGVLVGLDTDEICYIPASKLTPGPHKTFSIPKRQTIEALCDAVMDGSILAKSV